MPLQASLVMLARAAPHRFAATTRSGGHRRPALTLRVSGLTLPSQSVQESSMRHLIRDYMTGQTWTVQVDDSLKLAREMMEARGVHHLPVMDAGAVVGMVTTRELDASFGRLGTVADLMKPAERVSGDTPLGDVLDRMTSAQCDAVVVTDGAKVQGIFTATDALRVLARLVRQRAA
jgi:acetoin utilization protein AcuB